MSDEKLDRVMPLAELLPLSSEDVRGILLHEIRMFYSPLEAGIEVVLDLEDDGVNDQDHVIELMKQNAQLIEKYIDHIQNYLKARQDLKDLTLYLPNNHCN